MSKGTLKLSSSVIEVVKPTIIFPEYEGLIKEAQRVSEFIDSIELNDENVKEVKGVLAKANRAIKELNDRRIAIKKEILEPYEVFASQIKEIETIVKDSDTRLRNEVRELEENLRLIKKEEIEEIWNKRVKQYEYAKLMDFENFLENRHLNKSTSMNSVEKDMVDFLDRSENDLNILSANERKDEAISLYKECKDLGMVIATIRERIEESKKNEEILNSVVEEKEEKEKTYIFTITGKRDKNFVEMLLKENEINYELKEI